MSDEIAPPTVDKRANAQQAIPGRFVTAGQLLRFLLDVGAPNEADIRVDYRTSDNAMVISATWSL